EELVEVFAGCGRRLEPPGCQNPVRLARGRDAEPRLQPLGRALHDVDDLHRAPPRFRSSIRTAVAYLSAGRSSIRSTPAHAKNFWRSAPTSSISASRSAACWRVMRSLGAPTSAPSTSSSAVV